MPCSTKGVLKQRSRPYFSCKWLVARKTPPKTPTSSPKQSTRSSSAMAISRALLIACNRFILAMSKLSLGVKRLIKVSHAHIGIEGARPLGVSIGVFAQVGLEHIELALQGRCHLDID